MKIIILMGSPNPKGSTSILAEEFKRGAEEAGHTVELIDVCRADVNPCIGCTTCGFEGPCVQKDGNEAIRAAILSADMVVFATPLYFFGMSAQLKAVVDRFCAYKRNLQRMGLKSALLTVAWYGEEVEWTFDALKEHYKTLVRYLHFEDQGMVIGFGCPTPDVTRQSRYPRDAYLLGRSC